MSLNTAIERIQRGLASVVFVYKSHDRWPLPSNLPKFNRTLQISVLDSSFNPPTLAHRTLFSSPNPFASTFDYDAKLLLLSVRNADKLLKPGDATLVQRLEMMIMLAQEARHDEALPPNVAVAIIDQPTFVGKSSSLRQFLHSHLTGLLSNPDHGIDFQLLFLIGFDTLERIVSPRYYLSEEEMHRSLRVFLSEAGDNSRLVCARRPGLTPIGSNSERSTFKTAEDFSDSQRLALIDIEDTVATVSSTRIRHQIATGDTTWIDATTAILAHYIQDHNLYRPPET